MNVMDEIIKCFIGVSVGDPTPSERELEKLTGISRTTIRESLVRLEALGFINKSQGRATKLIKALPEVEVNEEEQSDLYNFVVNKYK